jgi:predicted DCC family thiol-disulfide oxidoreductase YuxK
MSAFVIDGQCVLCEVEAVFLIRLGFILRFKELRCATKTKEVRLLTVI